MTGIAATPSPCNDICRMDDATGLCQGCLRTLDEIARWSTMQGDERLAVWSRIEKRRALLPVTTAMPPAPGSGVREE